MSEQLFIEELKKINISVTEEQLKQLQTYYELLIEWNEKINLTSITNKNDVYLKHYYDSITLSKIIDFLNIKTLCDVGTGAGFPGLVLKIIYPHIKITLVDSLQKRINFLNMVIAKLNLTDIETIHERSEEYAKMNRDKFDVVTARAVADLRILFEICVPMVKVNGYFIPMKGNISREILNVERLNNVFNCQLETQMSFYLPYEHSERTLLKFKKNKSTHPKYPRKYSDIKNKIL